MYIGTVLLVAMFALFQIIKGTLGEKNEADAGKESSIRIFVSYLQVSTPTYLSGLEILIAFR